MVRIIHQRYLLCQYPKLSTRGIISLMETFTVWLKKQLETRGMSGNKLAKLGGISQANVSKIMAGKQKVTSNFCVIVAKVFELPVGDVLAIAGLGEDTPTKEYTELFQVVEAASKLTPADRQSLAPDHNPKRRTSPHHPAPRRLARGHLERHPQRRGRSPRHRLHRTA